MREEPRLRVVSLRAAEVDLSSLVSEVTTGDVQVVLTTHLGRQGRTVEVPCVALIDARHLRQYRSLVERLRKMEAVRENSGIVRRSALALREARRCEALSEHQMSIDYLPPPRRWIPFSEALAQLDKVAELVMKHDVELVLERDGANDVALIRQDRLQYFQALEASLLVENYGEDAVADALAESPSVPSRPRVAVPLAMDYYVANTNVSPRQVLERYRIECDLPTRDEAFELKVRVADEQSAETHLATCPNFEPGKLSLPAIMLRAYCLARYGAQELPAPVDDYGSEFNQVVVAVVERQPHEAQQPPLFVLSLGAGIDGWDVTWVVRGSIANNFWRLDASHSRDPLHLAWHVVSDLMSVPFHLQLADERWTSR